MGEFGPVVPQGAANAARLIALVENPDSDLPADAIATLTVLVGTLVHLEEEIGKLDVEIERRAEDLSPRGQEDCSMFIDKRLQKTLEAFNSLAPK